MKETLTRSASDKFIGGVCGGVARSLGVDSGLVRIITVIGAFFFGIVIVVYVALWLVAFCYRLVRGVQGMAEGDFKLLAGLGAGILTSTVGIASGLRPIAASPAGRLGCSPCRTSRWLAARSRWR